MRTPAKKPDDKKELEDRARKAKELADTAPLSYQQKKEGGAAKESIIAPLLAKKEVVSVNNENSQERTVFNLRLNRCEKAALYLLSQKEDVSMQQYLRNEVFPKLIKKAKDVGLNEDVVDALYSEGKIK